MAAIRRLARIVPEEHHRHAMAERLADEEDAFAADIRKPERPVDRNPNGKGRSEGPTGFDP